MKYADLHIHSSYSDGTLAPEDIVKRAQEKGIRYISITDHDSIVSQYIIKNNYKNINLIPGIELSSQYKEFEIHILGYFIDIENTILKEKINKLYIERINRVENILFKLKQNNINLTFEDLNIRDNSTVGRSHVAKAMVKKGYFENYKTAFTAYLAKGKPAYVKGFKLECKEVIQIVNESGGIAVLAHPGQIHRGIAIENIIKELKCYGIKGMEVYHPSHYKNQTNYFYNIAKKNKLFITGGSDYHGMDEVHSCNIGKFGINQQLLDKLLKYHNINR